MAECSNDKDAAEACFKSIQLDEDLFRCGHTKASIPLIRVSLYGQVTRSPLTCFFHVSCIYK